jgi:sulfopyruvate decarboxylase subunit beta
MVSRYEILKALLPLISDETLVVASIGNNGKFWQSLTAERKANLLDISMGMCTPTGLGLALALPGRQVVVLDGDGNLFLNLGSLATVGTYRPPNLCVIVMNNGNYLSGGPHDDTPGMPTPTSYNCNIEAVAKACGIENAVSVDDTESFQNEMRRALSSKGPSVIVANITSVDYEKVKTSSLDTRENKFHFVRFVEKLEGIKILK